jgi:DNA (cytosine-5)-methyltransferase 1
MKEDIDLLELFSGIGGFAKGISDAGLKIKRHFFSEVDKHAIANYKYNFKNSIYVGSVTDVRGIIRTINKNRSGRLVITFGSPCQDFSLAGKGLGLDGNKSSLIKYAIFLIKWLKPDVFIWENVKGAFSTNDGADYWAIIQAFANLDGYGFEQQLLNTSWFLPQNRERIYLVGHLAGRSRTGVFPFTKSVGLHIEGYKEKSGQVASTLNANDNKSWVGNFINKVGKINSSQDGIIQGVDGISQCLSAGNGNVPKISTDNSNWKNKLNPLDDFDEKYVRLNQKEYTKGNSQGSRIYDADGLSVTLSSLGGGGGAKTGLYEVKSNTKKGFDIAKEGDSINLSNPNSETRRGRVGVGVAQTLDTQCNQAVVKSVSTVGRKEKNQNGSRFKEEESFTLCSQDQHGVQINNSIRRLTEIECERLQGFPDDWTRFGIYEKQVWINKKLKTFEIVQGVKEIPKTQRYKMCGNAVTVDIPREIAKRLKFL